MPESTYKHITDIETSDKEVKVRGWVYRIRKMKDKIFVVLRDATGILQCIGKLEDLSEDAWNNLNEVAIENAIAVKGNAKEDSRAVNNIELVLTDFTIIHKGEIFPIAKDQS